MKRIILSFLLLLILKSCNQNEPYSWIEGTDLEKILTKAENKLVLIDFETDWCKWCEKLDIDTFSDKNVKKFAKDHLLSLKVDAEKGEGPKIAKNYNVRGFPTIILANQKGDEIDRIVGYLGPNMFLKQLERIRSGKNTLPRLLMDFQLNPEKFSTMFSLAKKYEARGDTKSAQRMINAILNSNVDSASVAKFFSILYESREKENYGLLLSYVEENPKSDNVPIALKEAMYFIRRKGNNDKLEAEIYFKLINIEKENSLNTLNSFCWRMSEIELYLEVALEKITYAIKSSSNESQKYMFIDTKAELFFKLKKYDDAIIEIKKCIQFDSGNQYYKNQLIKFENKNRVIDHS